MDAIDKYQYMHIPKIVREDKLHLVLSSQKVKITQKITTAITDFVDTTKRV